MMLRDGHECRRGDCPEHQLGPADREQDEIDDAWRRALRCRTCGQPVPRPQDRIEVGGQHRHALFNPTGILFEVGCFAVAPGCRFEGEFTLEFTWFPGYA